MQYWDLYAFTGETSAISWSANDSQGCPASGSLQLANKEAVTVEARAILRPCLPVRAGTTYDFGMWIRIPQSASTGEFVPFLQWYQDANCSFSTSVPLSFPENQYFQNPGTNNQWKSIDAQVAAPSGAQAVKVVFQVTKLTGSSAEIDVGVDRISISPAP